MPTRLSPKRFLCGAKPPPAIPGSSQWQPVPELHDADIPTFRTQAFAPRLPHLLPSTFLLPAAHSWVLPTNPPSLNCSHLAHHAESTYLPIELTSRTSSLFHRVPSAPLSLFLSYASLTPEKRAQQRFYIAQAPLDTLPDDLRSDFPMPGLVRNVGTGSLYGTSLWMGVSGSSTPLHCDPNPNLLVQVAGTKIARLLNDEQGESVLKKVRRGLGKGEGTDWRFRGEEMMRDEKIDLEREIWDDAVTNSRGWETVLEAGDGLFIPDGWWHAIRSHGDGLNLSVCWLLGRRLKFTR